MRLSKPKPKPVAEPVEAMSLETQIDAISAKLLPILVEAAVQWTQNNFKKQQWEGSAWPARKKETKLSIGKAILVNRRDMYNAIRALGPDTFGVVGIPYARIHNEGGTINRQPSVRRLTFKRYKSGKYKGKTLFHKNNDKASFSRKANAGAYTINMPQRKFIGNGPELRKHLIKIAQQELKYL